MSLKFRIRKQLLTRNEGAALLEKEKGGLNKNNILSNYIKRGDIIMAHDYAYDIDKYQKDIQYKIWNWCEITESDISEASIRNNLTNYSQEIFDNVVWVCKIKK